MSERIQQVLVVGAGQMGVEVASKVRAAGLGVRLYDVNPDALAVVDQQIAAWKVAGRTGSELESLSKAARALTVETDPARAIAGCDLVVEAVTEDLQAKRDVAARFGAIADKHTIFATNSSSMVPSQIAVSSGRPDRFAAMHFLYLNQLVEIMGHARTSPDTLETLCAFIRDINHTPIQCLREVPGYLSNSLLFPLAKAALELHAMKAASFEDIDRCFMVSYSAPLGPFGYLDYVGLDTAIAVLNHHMATHSDRSIKKLVEQIEPLVAEGRLGVKAGQGFYEYPNPKYSGSTFLTGICPKAAAREVDTQITDWDAFVGLEHAGDGAFEAKFFLDPKVCPFLSDHEYRERPMLPVAATIAILRASLNAAWPESDAVGLQNLEIVNGLRYFTDRPETVVVTLKPNTRNGEIQSVDCELTYDFYNTTGKLVQARRPLVRATAELGQPTTSTSVQPAISATHQIHYVDDARMYRWGPSMQALSIMEAMPGGLRGQIIADCGRLPDEDVPNTSLSASIGREIAAIDACLMSSGCYEIINKGDRILVPQRLNEVRFGRRIQPNEVCTSVVTPRTKDGVASIADIALHGDDGELLINLVGYETTEVVLNGAMPIRIEPVAAESVQSTGSPEEASVEDWPLFNSVSHQSADIATATATLHPVEHGFLFGHQYRQTPLFPLTGILELTRYAINRAFPDVSVDEFCDIEVVNGLRFFTAEPDSVRVHLDRCGSTIRCELKHDFRNRAGKLIQEDRLLAQLTAVSHAARPSQSDIRHQVGGLRLRTSFRDDQSLTFFLGPAMRRLREVDFREESGCGLITAAPSEPLMAAAQRGIAVLDAGLCACNAHTQNRLGNGLQIPQKVGQVLLGRHARPSEECRVDFQVLSFSPEESLMQLAIRGDDETLIAEFRDYRCAVMTTKDGPLTGLHELSATAAAQ